ncbi:MAG: ABC transporter permease [Victivallaceae bacterium]|nr:ABC transporter permease [Victivallaceae bacterium]
MLHKWALAKDQIAVLVLKDFKLKYNSTALGFFWSFGVPVAQSLVYFFAFSVIMRFKVDNYLLYMLSGMFIWNFLCSSLLMSTNVFIANAELMKKTTFPRYYLVIGTISSELLHFILTIPILIVLMIFGGVMPSWSCLSIPIVLLNLIMITLGGAFLVASVNMFFRDLERIIGILLQLMFFLLPIIYPVKAIPDKYRLFMKLNPFYYILQPWRDIFYSPCLNIIDNAAGFALSLLILFIGYRFYKWKEPRFAEMV